eukprot:TRINITY_DN2800_c0_g2_i1.p3 TRINITY_DN2800_c0_g2~~TRINITY_DN2800_c0_g2_i1.p3  ORF type:complete len:263 (+),score=71.31 TRINITY_DN2800_c0_g2_i1:3622-4410(+)
MVTSAAGTKSFAQNTPANRQELGANAVLVTNASDNRLINLAIDTALGCKAWTVPDAADTTGATQVGALPLNELLATYRQQSPQALVPSNDPMVLLSGAPSVDKINLYRMGVNQPTIQDPATEANALDYCQKFASAAFARIQPNMVLFSNAASPDGVAANLYQFLVNTRFVTAISGNGGLNCVGLGVSNPFMVTSASIPANFTLMVVIGGTAGLLVVVVIVVVVVVLIQRRRAETAATKIHGFVSAMNLWLVGTGAGDEWMWL